MIYIGADHRGYNLKEKIKQWLAEWSCEFKDLGAFELNPEDDYPEFAKNVAENIKDSEDRGIVICGSGVGVDDVVNKFQGVRSGLAINKEQIQAARNDDDINVLALASDFISEEDAKDIVKMFLETEFGAEDRFKRRIHEIEDIGDEI